MRLQRIFICGMTKKLVKKDCEWHIEDHDMEFGRSPFRALGNFHDKWLYACASLVHEYNDANYKKLESLALKYVHGLKRIIVPMISDSVADKNHPANKDKVAGKLQKDRIIDVACNAFITTFNAFVDLCAEKGYAYRELFDAYNLNGNDDAFKVFM